MAREKRSRGMNRRYMLVAVVLVATVFVMIAAFSGWLSTQENVIRLPTGGCTTADRTLNATSRGSCFHALTTEPTSQETLDAIMRARGALAGSLMSRFDRALLYDSLRCFDFNLNLLVWGTGKDSGWIASQNNGKTIFLEHQEKWIDVGNSALQKLNGKDAKVLQVAYDTSLRYADSYLHSLNTLEVPLPEEVWDTRWDVVLVDAPQGFNRKQFGRMSSIYTTRLLRQRRRPLDDDFNSPVSIAFIHDMERQGELTWGMAIFGEPCLCKDILCMWML